MYYSSADGVPVYYKKGYLYKREKIGGNYFYFNSKLCECNICNNKVESKTESQQTATKDFVLSVDVPLSVIEGIQFDIKGSVVPAVQVNVKLSIDGYYKEDLNVYTDNDGSFSISLTLCGGNRVKPAKIRFIVSEYYDGITWCRGTSLTKTFFVEEKDFDKLWFTKRKIKVLNE